MLNVKFTVAFALEYNQRVKKGTVAEIGAIRRKQDSLSGVQFRVDNLWKRGQWFDIAWFRGLEIKT